MSSDLFPPFRADAGELLPAVVACGGRFVALGRASLIPSGPGDDLDLAARIDQLEPWVHSASSALGLRPPH